MLELDLKRQRAPPRSPSIPARVALSHISVGPALSSKQHEPSRQNHWFYDANSHRPSPPTPRVPLFDPAADYPNPLHPSRSSNPPPKLCPSLCTGLAPCPTGGAGAAVAPQMPALAFSLAILARLGPWLPGVVVFLMPAPALAVDQRDPKTSPPLAADEDLVVLVAAAGLPKEALDAKDGRALGVPVGVCEEGLAAVTEVK